MIYTTYNKQRLHKKQGVVLMDENLSESAKWIIDNANINVSEEYLIDRFSHLLSSSLLSYELGLLLPIQQEDHHEG